ncbi:MAG TPA: hypothetical protein VFZ93_00210 [Albitalea sp.]
MPPPDDSLLAFQPAPLATLLLAVAASVAILASTLAVLGPANAAHQPRAASSAAGMEAFAAATSCRAKT